MTEQLSPKDTPFTSENIFLFIIVLFVAAVFGFNYADTNQNTYLIDGLVKIHPNFLTNDWLARDTVHYYKTFTFIMIVVSWIGDLGWNLAIMNYFTIIISLLFIYKIINHIESRNKYFIFIMYLYLVVLDKTISVADSYIFSVIFQPSSISSLFTIVAIYYFIKSKYLFSGLALGVGGFFHTNFLLLGFVFFGLSHLFLGRKDLFVRLLKQLSLSTLIFILQIPFLLQMSSADGAKESQYIFQFIRSPHHYVPMTFMHNFVLFFGWHLIAVSIIIFKIGKFKINKNLSAIYFSFIIIVTSATLLTTVIFVPLVSQLFFWRMAPFSIMLAQLIILFAISQFVLNNQHSRLVLPKLQLFIILLGVLLMLRGEYYRIKLTFFLFLLFIVTIVVLILWQRYSITHTKRNFSEKSLKYISITIIVIILSTNMTDVINKSSLLNGFPGTAEKRLYHWVKDTSQNCTFLVPPDLENFRIQGKRAIVVDWKSTPVDPKGLLEWYRRIGDICGNSKVKSMREADIGYSKMSLGRMDTLKAEYNIKYAVFYKKSLPKFNFGKKVYSGEEFVVL